VKLVHCIKLLGAKEPSNFITLEIDPPQTLLDGGEQVKSKKVITPTPTSPEQQPLHTEGKPEE